MRYKHANPSPPNITTCVCEWCMLPAGVVGTPNPPKWLSGHTIATKAMMSHGQYDGGSDVRMRMIAISRKKKNKWNEVLHAPLAILHHFQATEVRKLGSLGSPTFDRGRNRYW